MKINQEENSEHPEGLRFALCALTFFRHRHDRKALYRQPNNRHAGATASMFVENVRLARRYIRMAREAGWRGSIRAALE